MFNDKFYRQTFGLPMGSPLSPILADLVMQNLELVSLNKFSVTPLFYVRYIDNIALAIDSAHILMRFLLNLILTIHDYNSQWKLVEIH